MPPGPKRVPAGTKKNNRFVAKAPRGTLTVTVKDGKAAAIAGAGVQVEQPGGRVLKGQTTAAGTVDFPSVVAGQSKITIRKEGFKPGAATVQVAAAAAVVANAVLQPATANLVVTVIDSAGTALAGADVGVETPAPAMLSQKTDAKGKATFKDLTAGTYQVSAKLDNYTGPAAAKSVQVTVKGKNSILVTLKPNPVVAEITPAPLLVVVKKHGCSPARKQFTVKANGPPVFTGAGTGTFTCSKTNVQFFKAAAGGAKIEFKNGDNVFTAADLTKGVQLFAEGTAASKAVEDIKLTLALSVGTNKFGKPATVKATALELTLEVFQSRTAAGAAPSPMPGNTKTDVGRFIHVQDPPAFHHGRAMVAVRAQPADFKQTIELNRIPGTGGLQLVSTEKHDPAETILALPLRLTAADVAAPVAGKPGKAVFVEGKTVSNSVGDIVLRLGIQGDEPDGDRAVFTVFQIDKIDVTLPATPCLRTGARAVMATKTSTTDNAAFLAADPVVVRESDDLDFRATVRPDRVAISWIAEQAADDAGPRGVPGVGPDPADRADTRKMKLKANATGSFHVHAFVDQNGNRKRGPGESGLIFNLHMVEIRVLPGAANNRILTANHFNAPASPGNLFVDSGIPGAFVPANNSVYADAVLAQHAIGARLSVRLIGGGDKQRRGVANVGLGVLQNDTNEGTVATYADGSTVRFVAAQNPATPEPILANPPPPAPAWPLVRFPVRDHRSATDRGYGVMINSSSDGDGKGAIPADGSAGEIRHVRFIDSPGYGVPLTQPRTGSALAAIGGRYEFRYGVVAFSTDFDENFIVLAEATWNIGFGAFTAVGGWTNAGAAVNPSGATMAVHSPPITLERAAIEHCQPGITSVLRTDAR